MTSLAAIALALGAALAAGPAGRTIVVGPEGDLAGALAGSRDGDTVEVRGGRHLGPFAVPAAVALVGLGRPVLDGGGQGTVVTFEAGGGRLAGFVIVGSGDRPEREDAGVLARGTVTVEDCALEGVLYGIDVKQGPGSRILRNRILGRDVDVARRGDAIRLWESPGSVVEGNDVERARDVVIWYSEGVTVRGNQVRGSRYGLHFMYAAGSRVTGNRFSGNAVGAYAMYSSDLIYERNVFAGNHGPSGYGIALKDSDDVTIRDNVLAGNRTGLYLDNSPSRPDVWNQIERNTFAFNDIGAAFMPSVRRNAIGANSFVENTQQVAVMAGGAFDGNDWTPGGEGNFWSDYAGYDADGDGRGDLPYRSVRLFDDLLERQPNLRLFLLSPAQAALDLAARTFPIFEPPPTVVDSAPMMAAARPALSAPAVDGRPLAAFAAMLLALAIGVGRWGARLDHALRVPRAEVAETLGGLR